MKTHSPEELKRMAGVMLAASDGKKIEWKYKEHASWYTASQPAWDWKSYDYRVKPEPIELELWVNPEHHEWGFVAKETLPNAWYNGGWVKRKFREVVDGEDGK